MSSFAAKHRRDEDTPRLSGAIESDRSTSCYTPTPAQHNTQLIQAHTAGAAPSSCTVAVSSLTNLFSIKHTYDTLLSLGVFSRDIMLFPMFRKCVLLNFYYIMSFLLQLILLGSLIL